MAGIPEEVDPEGTGEPICPNELVMENPVGAACGPALIPRRSSMGPEVVRVMFAAGFWFWF